MALNDVIYNKKVDVAQAMPVPVVFAKQNDNAKRKVVVTLVKNGQPFVLGTGVNGYIQGATAPNPVTKRQVKFKRDLTAIDTTQGTATFIITESMTAEIGITQCEVSIYDTEKPQEILCTANINIEVQGTGMSLNDEMASDDYQAIVNIKAEVTAMRDEVVTKTAQAIAAQGAAETAAQNAYNSALGVQKIVAGNEAYTKDEVDLKFSRAPRKTATGKGEIMLADSDQGKAYVELQGNSEQNTKMSDNLYIKKDADLNHALTWDSGTLITEQGAIAMPVLQLVSVGKIQSNFNIIVFLYKDSTYVGSLGTNGEVQGPGIVGSDAKMFYITATTLSSANSYRVVCRSSSNSNLDMTNQAVDIRFVLTEDSTVSIPSPKYPSEVQSVGDIPKDSDGVEIRNLFNNDAVFTDRTSFGYVELGDFTDSIRYAMYKMPDNPISGLYVRLSTDITKWAVDAVDVQIIVGSKWNSTIGTQYSYKPPNGTKLYLKVAFSDASSIRMPTNEELKSLFDSMLFMVTPAITIDEYRPYIGENNGLVKIESSGVNKVDVGQKPVYDAGTDSINIITWTPQEIILDQKGGGTSYAYANVNLIVGKTYSFYCRAQVVTIDGSPTTGATTIGFRKYPPSGMIYGQTGVARDGTYHDCYSKVELPEDVSLMLYVNSTSSSGGNVRLIVKDLMVVEGGRTLQEMKALKYQPYYNKITWIPLREPLRGITGNNLKLYADKVDKNGYVTQNIYFAKGKDMLSFNTDALGINVSDNPYKYAYWTMQDETQEAYSGTISVLCNMLKRGTYNVNQMAITNTSVVVFNLPNTLTGLADAETDKAAITAAIKAWVNTNNPMVYYALKNPIEYQIPMVYIETYEQETNVRCLNKVKPSSMGLDYKIAISSLIKRLEALESAAVNNGGK